MPRMKRAALLGFLFIALALPTAAQQPRPWRDTFESRLEIVALLQTLNGELLAGSSATRTLETWCGEHHLAAEAKVVAVRITGVRKEPSVEQLQRLDVHDPSEVRYRRVELRCGAHVLSVADNWYVPARLTPEMNALLETSNTPFGKAVQPLHPDRHTIHVAMLWSPLPQGWEQQPRSRFASYPRRTLAIPKELFEHRAVLSTAGHIPFSEVVETYQSDVLAFGRE
jgi:chorismate-pyruvate lyase